jgi:hypothetical protein
MRSYERLALGKMVEVLQTSWIEKGDFTEFYWVKIE